MEYGESGNVVKEKKERKKRKRKKEKRKGGNDYNKRDIKGKEEGV